MFFFLLYLFVGVFSPIFLSTCNFPFLRAFWLIIIIIIILNSFQLCFYSLIKKTKANAKTFLIFGVWGNYTTHFFHIKRHFAWSVTIYNKAGRFTCCCRTTNIYLWLYESNKIEYIALFSELVKKIINRWACFFFFSFSLVFFGEISEALTSLGHHCPNYDERISLSSSLFLSLSLSLSLRKEQFAQRRDMESAAFIEINILSK